MKNKVKIAVTELDRGGYHLFITVKVNGKKCRFLIDTGASHSVIDKGYYEKNLKKKSLKTVKQETTGLHSTVNESHFGVIKEVAVGKLLIKNYSSAAVDLSHVNATYKKLRKPKIDGILGSDILVKYKMVIDYGKKLLLS